MDSVVAAVVPKRLDVAINTGKGFRGPAKKIKEYTMIISTYLFTS